MKKYCDFCGCEQEFTVYENNSHALLRGNSHAALWDNSHAELWGNGHAELRGNSHAVLRENSHAVLWDNSHAELWGNSHALLRGNSHAVLRDNSHTRCHSPYACAILKSITAKCIGRHVGDKPTPATDYLADCGIEVKRGAVILYKSVNRDGTSKHSDKVKYIIGKITVAPDWDANFKGECGSGLHLSPTIQQACLFHDDGMYLACRVAVKDIAPLPAFAEYPDKIRVRACTPLYQVDKEGNKLEAKLES